MPETTETEDLVVGAECPTIPEPEEAEVATTEVVAETTTLALVNEELAGAEVPIIQD